MSPTKPSLVYCMWRSNEFENKIG